MGAPESARGSVSAPARSDFEKHIPGRRVDGGDHLPRPAGREKVLTESLARPARARYFAVGRLALALAAPILLLDRFDLFLGQPEVVPDLADQRLANGHDGIVFVVARVFDRALEERDLVGQRVAVRPLPLGERNAS